MTLGLVPVSHALVGTWICEGFPERVLVGHLMSDAELLFEVVNGEVAADPG